MTIVGVVGSVKSSHLYQEMAWTETPTLYRAIQQALPTEVSLIIRAAGQRSSIASTVQQWIARLSPSVAVATRA
jgi:hypothetical protein